jgi:N-acetylneuraminic acid mutarotase
MKFKALNFFIILNLCMIIVNAQGIKIKNLEEIPNNEGFAGSVAGICNGALVMIGGSNFPNGSRPWNGGTKVWYDHVYRLEKIKGKWEYVGKLPFEIGYAVAVSWNNKLVVAGGSNAKGHSNKLFTLEILNDEIKIEYLPDLPISIANATGALINNTLYIAGGLESPNSSETLKTFYAINLENYTTKSKWNQLESWEGPSRMLSASASDEENFYLISGVDLHKAEGQENISRVYLTDSYQYNIQSQKWTKLQELPHPTVAAPNPSPIIGNHIYILGGDDGEHAHHSLKEIHPGFSSKLLSYSIEENEWQEIHYKDSKKRLIPVTTPMISWKNGFVIVGGEAKPGIRTNKVLFIKPFPTK